MKVITDTVRFSYVHVHEPRSVNGGEPKYSVSLIIPKTDLDTLAKINAAIEAAKETGAYKFGGIVPSDLKTPLRDGDVDRPEDEAYTNSYFVNANSTLKPGIVDEYLQPITDPAEFYSGCYGRASIIFYAYHFEGNGNISQGIACGLQNLQKLADGEPLGVPVSAAEDFAEVANNNILG